MRTHRKSIPGSRLHARLRYRKALKRDAGKIMGADPTSVEGLPLTQRTGGCSQCKTRFGWPARALVALLVLLAAWQLAEHAFKVGWEESNKAAVAAGDTPPCSEGRKPNAAPLHWL